MPADGGLTSISVSDGDDVRFWPNTDREVRFWINERRGIKFNTAVVDESS